MAGKLQHRWEVSRFLRGYYETGRASRWAMSLWMVLERLCRVTHDLAGCHRFPKRTPDDFWI